MIMHIKPPTVLVAAKDNPQKRVSFAECVEQLSDLDEGVRGQAARELAAYEDAAGVLLIRLKEEFSPAVREVIFTSLVVQANPCAVEGLIKFLRSEDAGLRNGAIEALKLLPGEVAFHIPELLLDPDPDVRILTISILKSLRHPSVEDWLISVLEQDPHLNVCGAALDLLTEIGTGKSIYPINELRGRFINSPYVQFAADLALSRIMEAEGV